MRKILFWIHLVAGLVAGLVIAIMSFTGVVLAFEQELVAWAERDARRVTAPADPAATRLPLAELQVRVREALPEVRSPAISLANDPGAAVTISAGRDTAYYINPYTGEVRRPGSTAMHDFMHLMEEWHRFIALGGDNRPVGKAITGACNLAFLALAVSGLYLWWPRSWSWRGFKAVALLNGRLAGKARDFNWHNAIGFWCAPVLIVLTLTAVPISYRWGSSLIYRMVGEEPPAQGGPPVSGATAAEIARPSPEARPAGLDGIVAQVQAEYPRWSQITLRTGGANRQQRPAPGPAAPGGAPAAADAARSGAVPPLTIMIREAGTWPRTASTTLTVHPFTGEILRREGFRDSSTGRQVRMWSRFLHTGQALGWPGQAVAGLASLGALFLVYTGFALSWRRFLARGPRRAPASPHPAHQQRVSASQ